MQDKRKIGIKAVDKKITDKTIAKYGFELGEYHGVVDSRDNTITSVHYINHECAIVFLNRVSSVKFKEGYRSRHTIREFLMTFKDKLSQEILNLIEE